jgi:metal-responsive CopG/Arc/MetJ family transcriptional regulator
MSYTTVTIPTNLIENIKKIILETNLYRNHSEFVIAAVREKVEKIHQLQVDRMKLEVFFMKENRIKAEHLGKND